MNQNNPKWDWFSRKIVYIILQIALSFIKLYVSIYSRIYSRNKEIKKIKSIAAIWYWPYDFPSASFTRLGKWKQYFENESIKYDNFHISSMKEKVEEYEAGNWSVRYWFYIKILFARFKQFKSLKNYDVVWIDRWFLPYYPSKNAFWEKSIKRMVPKLIVDSTDGTDYESNPALILEIFQTADRITVAYEGLFNFYEPKFKEKVKRFNYTIIEDNYLIREEWDNKDSLVIGWMGSPYNFEYVKAIEKELQKVAEKVPFIFRIICRQDVKINIPNAKIEYYQYGTDYEQLLKSFDIGISPFTEKSFSNTGKIGMKHQEFLLCQIPQVCSPQGISEHAVHNENCIIANDIEDWSTSILKLIHDTELRRKIALNGRKMCKEHYTFEGQWAYARKALLEFK
jgi:glycosyltransferase involved in cell wall biosynthesis